MLDMFFLDLYSSKTCRSDRQPKNKSRKRVQKQTNSATSKNMTHTIHVWYIYLHWSHKNQPFI